MKPPTKNFKVWFPSFLLLALLGCTSPIALKNDYIDYAKVYGDASNKQLLLNLARLANDHPVYFIQLSTISSQYTVSTTAGFNPTYTQNSAFGIPIGLLRNIWTFGGTTSAGLTQNPIFSFLPISGTNYVQAVLTPIPDRIFYTFYDQGYPADLIARTMVGSVQHEILDETNHTRREEVLVNDPNDPTYPKFIEFCSDFRSAQLYHLLVVEGVTNQSMIYSVTNSKANAKLGEIVTSIQAGLVVTNDKHGTLFVTQPSTNIELRTFNPIEIPNRMEVALEGLLPNMSNLVFDRRPAESRLGAAQKLASEFKKHYRFKMRTFEAALYSAAKQEVYFRNFLESKKPAPYYRASYSSDQYGPYLDIERGPGSVIRIRPLMTLTYNPKEKTPKEKLASVSYGNETKKTYMVADQTGSTQNRLVFTMLNYLYSQTAISTQNLPVQQLIQVQ